MYLANYTKLLFDYKETNDLSLINEMIYENNSSINWFQENNKKKYSNIS